MAWCRVLLLGLTGVLSGACSGGSDADTTSAGREPSATAPATTGTVTSRSIAGGPASAVPSSTLPNTTIVPTAPTVTTTGAPASATTTAVAGTPLPASDLELLAFPVPAGSRPHDVAPAADGGVWYTAQGSGELGWLDPATGATHHIPLGPGSRPHGVIVGADGTPWITDGGLNAIVAVDPGTEVVTSYPLPDDRPDANLNTATFDGRSRLWFTGQNGIYGVLDPASSAMEVFDAPGGEGPYGIATTPDGTVYYASLAGSHVGRIDDAGGVTILEPPTQGQGARRVWSDSKGAVWVSEWSSGQLSRYDPVTDAWSAWMLPGDDPQPYAVFVDQLDSVWVSDFGANALVRFDPATEAFDVFPLPSSPGDVRQILGRSGEVWGAESAADQLVVIRPAG